jgi:parallel beta-helix repeat protein
MTMLRAVLVISALLVTRQLCFAQGSLAPPGSPAATMKSLDQIEPRIDLLNAPASAVTTDANNDFIINQPGSYYLSANHAATKANAIEINVAGVTLDFRGFQISKGSGPGNVGILIAATAHGATVENGSINGFTYGLLCSITTDQTHGCLLRDLDVSGCGRYGILAGFGATIQSCRAHDNGPFTGSGIAAGIGAEYGSTVSNCTADHNALVYGIDADNGCVLVNCAAYNNTVTSGIQASQGCSLSNCVAYSNTTTAVAINAGKGSSLLNCAAFNNTAAGGINTDTDCSLTNCTAYSNTSSASFSFGINTDDRCTIVNCTATNNTDTNASASGTTGGGISAGSDAMVKNCTASGNKGDGIHVVQRTHISDCTANSNGNSGIATDIRALVHHCNASNNQRGIVVLGGSTVLENDVAGNGVAGIDSSGGSGSRIEGNQARDNTGTGILTNLGGLDVVIRNSAGGTGTAYNPGGGPNFGPIQSPSTTTNPTANIQF